MSLLHRAARLGKCDEVAACLAQGEDVDAVGLHHFSALMLAAREGHLPVVVLLLDAGADPSIRHPNWCSALHLAASSTGCTPAFEAARFNYRDVVSFLHDHGANASFKDWESLTAEDWLTQSGVQGRFKWLSERFGGLPGRENAERSVQRLMAEGLSADEFVAKL